MLNSHALKLTIGVPNGKLFAHSSPCSSWLEPGFARSFLGFKKNRLLRRSFGALNIVVLLNISIQQKIAREINSSFCEDHIACMKIKFFHGYNICHFNTFVKQIWILKQVQDDKYKIHKTHLRRVFVLYFVFSFPILTSSYKTFRNRCSPRHEGDL